MNKFDDLLPEERVPEHEELITLLQRVYRKPAPLLPIKEAQVLERVRERLLMQAGFEDATTEDIHVPQRGVLDSTPHKSESQVGVRPRGGRHYRLITLLAAILVITMVLGTTLLLFRHQLLPTVTHPANTPPIGLASASPIGPIGKPITVHTTTHGLEMTMQITPGPYFLSEMLAVNLSLTNHTNTIFLLQGSSPAPGPSNDSCHPPLKIVMTGGQRPYDLNLQSALAATISCYDSPGTVQLQPAQTITNYQYFALTSSGAVTLAARATFQKQALQDGVIQIVPTTSPLEGHWPSLKITVQAGVPSDRAISLHQQSNQVIVDAPLTARGQLIYMSVFDCDLGKGSNQHGGTDRWIGLPMMAIQKPQCGFSMINRTPVPGKFLRWTYVVGAPGYVLASGKYPTLDPGSLNAR